MKNGTREWLKDFLETERENGLEKSKKEKLTPVDFSTLIEIYNDFNIMGSSEFIGKEIKNFLEKNGFDVEEKGIGWKVIEKKQELENDNNKENKIEDEYYYFIGIKTNIEGSETKKYFVSENVYNYFEDMKDYGGYRRYNIDVFDRVLAQNTYREENGKLYFKETSFNVMRDLGKELISIPEYKGGVYYNVVFNGRLDIRHDEDGKYEEYDWKNGSGIQVGVIKDGIRSLIKHTTREEAVLEMGDFIKNLMENGVINENEYSEFRKQKRQIFNSEFDVKPIECYKVIKIDGSRLDEVFDNYVNGDLKRIYDYRVNLSKDINRVIKSSYKDRDKKEIFVLEYIKKNGMNNVCYFKKDFNLESGLNFIKRYEFNKNKFRDRVIIKENSRENGMGR